MNFFNGWNKYYILVQITTVKNAGTLKFSSHIKMQFTFVIIYFLHEENSKIMLTMKIYKY